MRRKKQIKKAEPDVRPLDKREIKLDTRKGMIRKNQVDNISWLNKQMNLFFSE